MVWSQQMKGFDMDDGIRIELPEDYIAPLQEIAAVGSHLCDLASAVIQQVAVDEKEAAAVGDTALVAALQLLRRQLEDALRAGEHIDAVTPLRETELEHRVAALEESVRRLEMPNAWTREMNAQCAEAQAEALADPDRWPTLEDQLRDLED
jgi:hypothetical protein